MSRWLPWIGKALLGLVVLIAVGVAIVVFVTNRRINREYTVEAPPIQVTTDSATVARGRHMAVAIGKCVDCHGENFGGMLVFNDGAMGKLASSNLTSGGVLSQYSDAELARAIRTGVMRNGRSQLFMPSTDYAYFTDTDVAAIIAYLRSLAPVKTAFPPRSLGPISRMLVLKGDVPVILPASHMDKQVVVRTDVPPGPTVEFGKYLARVGGCHGCHGEQLKGGPVPGGPPDWPPATDLKRIASTWSEADFTRALRTGYRPDKTVISAVMPWKYTALMNDDEIRALWLYIRSLPAN
jgi:mono/diheme cytochrome c family protein